MTTKEQLTLIIKKCGSCYTISCIDCVLNTDATTRYPNIPCTWKKVDRASTTDDEYRYKNAIIKYVELFGPEDIVEALL